MAGAWRWPHVAVQPILHPPASQHGAEDRGRKRAVNRRYIRAWAFYGNAALRLEL